VPIIPAELRRGDVVRVRLDWAEGSEQTGERPALVLSPDVINRHSPIILIAPITSKKTERIYPFEALVELGEGGLPMRSKVLLMQTRSLDKSRLLGYYGRLSDDTMQQVDQALKIAAGLR
jgi:mRNA interferase MazF